jgi:hypothetical protein
MDKKAGAIKQIIEKYFFIGLIIHCYKVGLNTMPKKMITIVLEKKDFSAFKPNTFFDPKI